MAQQVKPLGAKTEYPAICLIHRTRKVKGQNQLLRLASVYHGMHTPMHKWK